VAKKGMAFNPEMDAIAFLQKHGSGNSSNGVACLAMGTAKCAEIMNPDENPRGLLHRGDIERPVDTGRCSPDQRVALAGMEDTVSVCPPAGVSSGIPIKRHIRNIRYGNIVGKIIIDCPMQRLSSQLSVREKLRHLVFRVNSGVGPPGSMNAGKIGQYMANGFKQHALYGSLIILHLPPAKIRSVVTKV